MRFRVQQLELLCAEVYAAAVEIGLPQPLLNKLWTVAAQGSTPHAFAVNLPNRPAVTPMQIPDIRLTDRPIRDGEDRPVVAKPELEPLAERRRVMVVDDDPMMMEVLVRILQRENDELTVAGSGAEALEKAAAAVEPIDLLVTDYVMPEMKGHELAERMRARYPAVRVLYQTGLREAARFILFGSINPTAALVP